MDKERSVLIITNGEIGNFRLVTIIDNFLKRNYPVIVISNGEMSKFYHKFNSKVLFFNIITDNEYSLTGLMSNLSEIEEAVDISNIYITGDKISTIAISAVVCDSIRNSLKDLRDVKIKIELSDRSGILQILNELGLSYIDVSYPHDKDSILNTIINK